MLELSWFGVSAGRGEAPSPKHKRRGPAESGAGWRLATEAPIQSGFQTRLKCAVPCTAEIALSGGGAVAL